MSLSMSRAALAIVDSKRGSFPRSRFFESLVEAAARQPQVSREELREHGIVYTPPDLADYVAQKVVGYLFEDVLRAAGRDGRAVDPGDLRILDPACGSGELLLAAWRHLKESLDLFPLYAGKVAIEPQRCLCGVDSDRAATAHTKVRIDGLDADAKSGHTCSTKVVTTNALFPYGRMVSAVGWRLLKQQFDADNGFDIVIANPPWGADVAAYRDKLSLGEFSLFQGQFDTADLFMELSLKLLKPNGYLAFIVPDSLFSQERRALRQLLLSKTQIKFIGRFGEKLFEGINRACAVVICRRGTADASSPVECLRLTPEARKEILSGNSTFAEQEGRLGHKIPQSRFSRNDNSQFDIDVSVVEERTFGRLGRLPCTLGDHLVSGRGIELSKHGWVYQCGQCKSWSPLPKGQRARCPHCKTDVAHPSKTAKSIVRKDRHEGYVPFIVGEHVSRYALHSPLWIVSGCSGVNYKDDSLYRAPKLLVRKTGVGLSAAVDYSDARTNQVVYIFRLKDSHAAIPLEFFLAVLNSRAMYYYITKTHGETEWRSHPYVTQTQILSLPLPAQKELLKESEAARKIAALVRPYMQHDQALPANVDAEVERLVARVYGLGHEQYKTIYATLESVQDLLPVRRLKQVPLTAVFPA